MCRGVFFKAVGSDLMRCYELHVVKITEIISINELNTDFTLQSYKTRENSSYHEEVRSHHKYKYMCNRERADNISTPFGYNNTI